MQVSGFGRGQGLWCPLSFPPAHPPPLPRACCSSLPGAPLAALQRHLRDSDIRPWCCSQIITFPELLMTRQLQHASARKRLRCCLRLNSSYPEQLVPMVSPNPFPRGSHQPTHQLLPVDMYTSGHQRISTKSLESPQLIPHNLFIKNSPVNKT